MYSNIQKLKKKQIKSGVVISMDFIAALGVTTSNLDNAAQDDNITQGNIVPIPSNKA